MPAADLPLPRLLSLLRESDLFQDLSGSEMDQILINLRMIRTQKGFEIIRQGDSWDSFYVILSGKVSIKFRKGSRVIQAGKLGKGEFFGEIALLAEQPRTATVTSEEISELLVLKKSEFDTVLMRNPVRAEKIRRAYMERTSTNKKKALAGSRA
jgi:CRP-like cAMP-binding protein